MGKEVLLVERTFFREAGEVLGRAFKDDPAVLSIFDGITEDGRVQRLNVAFASMFKAVSKNGLLLHVKEKGRVAGVAIIHPPGVYPLPSMAQMGIILRYIARMGFKGVSRWMELLSAYEKKHPKESHYYLETIGVDTELQGQGIGSALLQHLVQKADEDGVGAYLESSNLRNNPLYKRFGFEVMSEEKIIGVPISFMWRPIHR